MGIDYNKPGITNDENTVKKAAERVLAQYGENKNH